MADTPEIPTKPYLIRARYEWCVDSGHTPYLAVTVNSQTRVPMEYVKNGEIVLNIGASAVHKLVMGNEVIEFAARFNGVSRDISVPMEAISGIYARETGQGMAFEITAQASGPAPLTAGQSAAGEQAPDGGKEPAADDDTPPPPNSPNSPKRGGRPKLQIVK